MKMKKWAALAALLLAVGAATGATAEVAVNDHVFFGHYEQDNDLTNGAEAIEWRVLKVENGEALLISQYALDSQPYNEKYAVALWSECTLRTWLNTAFYDAAFNDTEKQGIVTKELENWKDVNTQDTVSLLDNDEAKTLFENHADRMTVPTAYAIAQGAWQSQKYGPGNAQWWLRSHSWEEKRLTFSAELESVDCTSNEELLRQVWINLLNNAIRYIPPGGEIGVELRQVGGEAVVRVWDTGSGMTPEVQSHIFEKYYQGAAEDKKHGLGLGLSIVHRIIELTEGRIEVDSQPQQGSSFTVYLPLNQKGA